MGIWENVGRIYNGDRLMVNCQAPVFYGSNLMCGIAGVQGKIDLDIEGCLTSLSHRGPDARGTFQDKDTLFAHTRLSILDLSEAGNQPMSNEDDTIWIVFNGEIYNAPDLRRELEDRGHAFKSTSDTEVLIHLFEEERDKMVSRLRGMFAFSVYDRKRGEIFLARDPLGIKPLVYAQLPSGFLFASEIKSLLNSADFPREIDHEALMFYFHFNYIPAPLTIWKHARKLKPGHCLKVKNGKIQEEYSYWNLEQRSLPGNFEEAVLSLETAIIDSVKYHLLSDVPVGSFLSGGVDSSLIATIAQQFINGPLQTFTVTYPEFPYLDESAYARKIARKIRSNHTEIPVRVKDIHEAIIEVCDHLDEPFGDPALIPTALLSKLTRNHVKVALSGDGGDELFAGYTKYQALKAGLALKNLNPLIKIFSFLPFKETRAHLLGDRIRQVRKFANALDRDTTNFLINLMSIFPPGDIENLYRHSFIETPAVSHLEKILGDYSALGESDMNKYLFLDTRFVLPNGMLYKIDTASMKYSLEVRVPFVDREVVDLISSFPGNWKLKGLQRKYILRKMAEKYLPQEIVDRKKMGFNVPIGEWCRDELMALFERAFDTNRLRAIDFLSSDYIDRIFKEHIKGKRDRFFELWNIFIFLTWWEKFMN